MTRKRNVRRGLTVRSKVIHVLEREGPLDTKRLAEKVGLSYSSVLHHLRLLKIEKIIVKQGKTGLWKLTGAGQQRLI
ncbi:MAG: ArsR family transcriptional regulator [Candidatus Bathyarchaeia archaeon]